MIDFLEKPTRWLAQASALIGGIVLLLVMLMTVISVTGLTLNKFGRFLKKSYELEVAPLLSIGPIPGETEMIETAMAFIIFAFMPIVTLNRGHARVEILARIFGLALNRIIDFVADLILFVVAVYLGYQHYLGTLDKYNNGETTWILQFPLWWGYFAALLGAVIFGAICAFCVLRSARHMINGTTPNPSEAPS